MNKQVNKLINDVSRVLKVLYEEGTSSDRVAVKYDFNWRSSDSTSCRAFIMFPTENTNTGNGYEKTYSWTLLEKLVNLSNRYNVSFHVGQTDSLEMHIHVYVSH